MVEETPKEEEETPEEEEGGGQFSIPMPFEDAVDALLRVKPEKRRGRVDNPPGGADSEPSAAP